MNQKHTHGITAPTYGAAPNHGINIAKEKRISELLNGTEKNALLDYFVNLAGAIYELETRITTVENEAQKQREGRINVNVESLSESLVKQIVKDLRERGIISG